MSSESSSSEPPHKKKKKTNLLKVVLPQPADTVGSSSVVVSEFERFLAEPLIDFDLDFSPCNWWKQNANRFPNLAKIARDILCIPASSANIEQLFSIALDILSAKRNKMKPLLFGMTVFIRRNLQVLENIKQIRAQRAKRDRKES